MSSIEALERIKSKYKGCLVKEAHNLPFSSDINIENIEEYWHIENKNDFSKIKEDLEILEILKSYMSIETEIFENENNEVVEYEYIAFNNGDLDIENKEEYNKIKEWLQGK